MQLQSAILPTLAYRTLGFRGAYFSVDDSMVNVKFCFAPFREGYVETIMPAGLYVIERRRDAVCYLRSIDTARVIALAGKTSSRPDLV